MSGYIDVDGTQYEHCLVCNALIKLTDGEYCEDHKDIRIRNGQYEFAFAERRAGGIGE